MARAVRSSGGETGGPSHPPNPGAPRPPSARPVLAGLAVLVGLVAGLVVPPPPASAATDRAVVEAIEADGRFVVPRADAALGPAIDRANAAGIAFVWLADDGDDLDAIDLADGYVDQLDAADSRYRTVLVVLGGGYGATSTDLDPLILEDALDAAFDGFAAGAMDRGLDAFTDTLAAAGVSASTTTPTTASSDPGSGSQSTGDADRGGGGFGFGSFLLLLLALGAAFLGFRAFRNRRRAKRQAAIELEQDRAEITSQLEDNADRVIDLGDRVIARGDRELIDLYDEASTAYQEVSRSLDGAATAAEIDALDDRIDRAEWQFEVIEAELEGRPRPPEPRHGDIDAHHPAADNGHGDDGAGDDHGVPAPPPPPAGDRPAAGTPPAPGDDRPPVVTSPRTGRTYPRTTGRRGGSRSGGGLGGGLGGILADIVLGGGGAGGLGTSRRARRRSGNAGESLGGGVLGRGGGSGQRRSGGLGGGVLRRGGSTRRPSRTRSRSSGGRSLRRSRSRGGRKL